MKAPFAVGEPVMCIVKMYPKSPFVLGWIYHPKEVAYNGKPAWGVKFFDAPGPGARNLNGTMSTGYWGAENFRPLNPDDYEALRLKHGIPEKVPEIERMQRKFTALAGMFGNVGEALRNLTIRKTE